MQIYLYQGTPMSGFNRISGTVSDVAGGASLHFASNNMKQHLRPKKKDIPSPHLLLPSISRKRLSHAEAFNTRAQRVLVSTGKAWCWPAYDPSQSLDQKRIWMCQDPGNDHIRILARGKWMLCSFLSQQGLENVEAFHIDQPLPAIFVGANNVTVLKFNESMNFQTLQWRTSGWLGIF